MYRPVLAKDSVMPKQILTGSVAQKSVAFHARYGFL